MTYLVIVVTICYVLMQFVETVSFSARIAGKLTKSLALGTTLQLSIFTMSRLFLPPILIAMSYMIESELSIQLFLMVTFTITILAFVSSLLVLFNLNSFQSLFQKLFFFYQSHSIPISIIKVLTRKEGLKHRVDLEYRPKLKSLPFKKVVASCFSYFFLSTGFLIAFSLAILIPEYRMTMSQLTTAFHGIGAVFLAMYIDPMMSRSLDVELKNNYWVDNIYSILVGRVLSYLVASLAFLGLYLFALLT